LLTKIKGSAAAMMAGFETTLSNDLRAGVREDLPEIELIADPTLRERVVDAWALSLSQTSFRRIRDMPGEANPGMLVLKRGGQDTHLRGVTQIAISYVDHFAKVFPEAEIDRDIVIAGGLCHDIGKAYEFDPENRRRWKGDPSKVGLPPIRHPVYGAHICLLAGLPEGVAHIAACHSPEGNNVQRSLECVVVHEADVAWWKIAAGSGLVQPNTFAEFGKMFVQRATR
jgi:putative nucleotidyltransferase with HDIG domain